MSVICAVPWTAQNYPDPVVFSKIVDAAIAHRPWFDDSVWTAGEQEKREGVIAHISSAYTTGRVWSVLRNGAICGILLLESVRPGVDATCHFLFFDRALANKRQLLKDVMADAFRRYELAVLRVEVPTFAAKLCGFLRKGLGFKFESEWLDVPATHDSSAWHGDKRVSRRFRTIRYEGRWHDSLLLSITADAFAALLKEQHGRQQDDSTGHEPATGTERPSGQHADEPALRRGRTAATGVSGDL